MTPLLHALPLPAALADEAGRVRDANAACGLPPGAVLAPRPGWTRHALPDGLWLWVDGGAPAALLHDLRNLLMAIGGAATAMGTLPDAAAESERAAILDAVRRGSAQLAAGGAPAPLELASWLRGAAGLLRRALGPGVALELRLPDAPLVAMAPPASLDRALLNLAANARAAQDGRGRFALSLRREGEAAVLEARDAGPGFSAAALARGTEWGFSEGAGQGLGLAGVRAAMEAAGGTVTLANAAEGGALVRLAMPLAGVAPVPRLVLLVEDEPALRQAAMRCLEGAGHRVAAHGDAESALAWMDSGGVPDLLATDVSLPGMDGPALARAARERRPGLPVLVASGYGVEGVAPPHRVLRKPYAPAELLGAVAALSGLAESA